MASVFIHFFIKDVGMEVEADIDRCNVPLWTHVNVVQYTNILQNTLIGPNSNE